jgi:hypothetical protein
MVSLRRIRMNAKPDILNDEKDCLAGLAAQNNFKREFSISRSSGVAATGTAGRAMSASPANSRNEK